MDITFSPYSKEQQLKWNHQTEKEKPKFKEQRYNRKKKQTKKHDPILKTPSRYKRAQFSMEDKQRIDELYGHACIVCGNQYIEYHHCKFASGMGRGKYRNGIPLCGEHHRESENSPHKSRETADKYRDHKLRLFGPYYFMDEYDLFKLGLIPSPTKELFERFMEMEEKKNREKVQC